MIRSPYTCVVLEVGGEYDFFVALISRRPQDLSLFYHEISTAFGTPFQRKDIAISMRHSLFGEKFLTGDERLFRNYVIEVTSDIAAIDAHDALILHALTSSNFTSYAHVARGLGIPLTTVDYRIKRLKQLQVIAGDLHELRGEVMGINNFLVLVSFKGLSEKMRDEFYAFVQSHPHVAHCTEDVGAWDFMLGVAALKSRDVTQLVEQLHLNFGQAISRVTSFPMFNARKVVDFPFPIEDQQAQILSKQKAAGE